MGSTRELPTGAFFQSRNSGESVPCREKWSKRTGRILAEYYLRIQYIHPLVLGTTPGLQLSTSLDLHFHLFSHPIGAVARPKIDFLKKNATENAWKRISEPLDFQIFWWGMPPDPLSGSRLWRSKLASSCSEVWPLPRPDVPPTESEE